MQSIKTRSAQTNTHPAPMVRDLSQVGAAVVRLAHVASAVHMGQHAQPVRDQAWRLRQLAQESRRADARWALDQEFDS